MLASEVNMSDLLERVISRVPSAAENREQTDAAQVARIIEAAEGHDSKWRLQGILAETRITTNFGKVPAHLVRTGDRVRTRSGRYLPVKEIREYKLDLDYVERHPEALPVTIKQGTIDGKRPTQDVLLSAEQLVTLDDKRAKPDFVHACEIPRVRQSLEPALGLVAYYKFALEEPAELFCEGVWVKSSVRANAER